MRTATVGIYGLDYVAPPIALCFCEVGFKVTGFDINNFKVDTLSAGQNSA